MAENSLEKMLEELKQKLSPEENAKSELLADCYMDLMELSQERLEYASRIIKRALIAQSVEA